MSKFDDSASESPVSSVECGTGVAAALVDGWYTDGTALECDTAWVTVVDLDVGCMGGAWFKLALLSTLIEAAIMMVVVSSDDAT